MRAIDIKAGIGKNGIAHMKASFKKNKKLYMMEALGLAIFMCSACFFGAMLEAKGTPLHMFISNGMVRNVVMGIMMGLTALFIFYSPVTSPSGSHINPAVTLSFLRMGKISLWDAFFYIVFQVAGGTIAVCLMRWWLGYVLIDPPVNTVVTVPGQFGVWAACCIEFITAFIMMSMVLFTTSHYRFEKYTRKIAACMVCLYVIVAGPVSGFGMNPARSFASALPAHTWTAFWIYLFIPVAGMLAAAELYLLTRHKCPQKKTYETTY
jgi:aquaporin Z